MTWGVAILWIVTALYVGQAGVNVWHGQIYQAMIVGGYALANLGLIFLSLQKAASA